MKTDSIWERKKPSFGFISTRFSGLDGVSLETRKWAQVMTAHGCPTFFMAGELDTDPAVSHLVPAAHFKNPEILELQRTLLKDNRRTPAVSRKVWETKEALKKEIKDFQARFNFDILVVQNALAIPVNIPLGLAITEFIAETGIPAIAHHHDFYWERDAYNSAAVIDYLRAAFPPVHPGIQHAVINSLAGADFSRYTGASWTLIPNVFDFKEIPPEPDDYSLNFRADIGLDKDALLILQPTRIVSRKGIEMAAELVKRLAPLKASLVISHEAGDEGLDYLMRIEEFARFIGVDVKMVAAKIGPERARDEKGGRIYSLWDAYQNADLVTYPSLYEGYGNAFVEAVYYKKPIFVNRYPIFTADIGPKGFDVVTCDGYLTDKQVEGIKSLLADRPRIETMVEKNYMLGWRYLSYEMLAEKLEQILVNIYGA